MARRSGQDVWCFVLALGIGIGLVACRASPGPADEGSIVRPEPAPAKQASPVLPPGCEELGPVLLSVEPALVSLTCADRFHDCTGRATLTVRSCAARAFEFQEVFFEPTPPLRSPVVSVGRMVRLEPGETWTMALDVDHAGVYELSLGPVVTSIGDPTISLGTTTLTVDNPAQEQAMTACRECNGDWGPRGIFGIEGCDCRTRDGGTPCDDGADCESQCIERGPGSGFRCSEFTTEWGCYAYLPEGWSKQRRRKGVGVAPPQVCVD